MAQLMPLPLTVSCFSKIQIGITFLVPSHPGSPGQRAVKRECVCIDNCTVGGLLIRHWSVDVESGNGETGMEHNSTCSLFSVIVTLTDDGLDHLCPVCLLSPPQYFHANLLSTPYSTVMECIWCTIEENFSILSQFKCACCCHRGHACSKDFSPIKSTSS